MTVYELGHQRLSVEVDLPSADGIRRLDEPPAAGGLEATR